MNHFGNDYTTMVAYKARQQELEHEADKERTARELRQPAEFRPRGVIRLRRSRR